MAGWCYTKAIKVNSDLKTTGNASSNKEKNIAGHAVIGK